jgi:4-hydroxyphenylacetate 3-monooxygenase
MTQGERVSNDTKGAAAAGKRNFRTGDEYKKALNDGRRVWIDGERVDNLVDHPATAGVVETHARWYDLHHDPAWDDILWRTDDIGEEVPVCFTMPRTPGELEGLAEALRAAAFLNAGNISHPACWGMLVFTGLWNMLASREIGNPERAKAHLDAICQDQRLVTAAYTPPQVARLVAPEERSVVKVVDEREDGIVVRGGFGIATGAIYADEVVSAPLPIPGVPKDEALFFSVPLNDPGVRVFLRKPATYSTDGFSYPLSTRFDEQDVSLFMDDVFIPWDRVFVDRDPEIIGVLTHHYNPQILAQLCRALARAEFSVGLGLALAESLGTAKVPAVETALTDLYIHASTLRTSVKAAVLDCEITDAGMANPSLMHMASGYMYAFDNRAGTADLLRNLGGQSVITAPSAGDLREGEDRGYVAEMFGGGSLDAEQRTLLWNAVRDHTVSTLEGREQIYTALATGGFFTWRKRIMGGATDSERMVTDAMTLIEESGGVELPISTRLGGANIHNEVLVK